MTVFEDTSTPLNALKASILSNQSQCLLTLGDFNACLNATESLLKSPLKETLNSSMISKCLFRRATAFFMKKCYHEALDVLKQSKDLDCCDQALDDLEKKIKASRAQEKEKEKKLYKKMFQ